MRRAFLSRIAHCVIAALGAVAAGPATAAEDWPNGPIQIVVPYAAGGSADRVARALAPFLEKELKTSIVVENRSGASGQIAVQYVMRRPADGNTILLDGQPNHSTPIVLQNAPYAFGDIEALNVHEFGNASLSVRLDSPYKTFEDFHRAVKANPGKISIALPRGGGMHMMAVLLQEKLGWDILIVPFDSGAPARTALLGGHVTAMINGAVSDAEFKSRIRSLALSTPIKLAVWPDVPYINDVLKAYGAQIPVVGDIRFLGVRKGTRDQYPDRFDRIVRAYRNVMSSPEYQAFLQKAGAADETAFRGPEESHRILAELHRLLVEHKDKFKQQ